MLFHRWPRAFQVEVELNAVDRSPRAHRADSSRLVSDRVNPVPAVSSEQAMVAASIPVQVMDPTRFTWPAVRTGKSSDG